MFPAQVCNALSSALCCNIALLFDDPASSDVALTAGDTTVHAHKTVLAAQSPTFRAMFQVSTVHAGLVSCSSCIIALCSWPCRALFRVACHHHRWHASWSDTLPDAGHETVLHESHCTGSRTCYIHHDNGSFIFVDVCLRCCQRTSVPQSGMRETHAQEIELGDMEGPVLIALISAMYGKFKEVPDAMALPLFLAADAYQVRSS